MRVEEERRVYITLTREEMDTLDKASTLIANIRDNMNSEDELALIDEDAIIESLVRDELRDAAALLFNMTEFKLEII